MPPPLPTEHRNLICAAMGIPRGRSDSHQVETALALLRPEIDRAGVRIEQMIAGPLPPVMCDALQIQQVLINLLRNAIEAITDAGQEHGIVTIEVARGEVGFLRIVVRDTGPGFPPELATGSPEPLKSTKPYGLGIGLSFSRSIVEAHGGQLTYSNVASGAAVSLSLPIADGVP